MEAILPVNLSIKNVPDDIAQRLKQRASQNHRSLQGELRAIVEQAASEARTKRRLTITEVREQMRALGVKTEDETTDIVRQARDER